MIPPRPTQTATGSERLVFKLLEALDRGKDAVALSSLNLSEHEYKRWGEIDFVVVMSSILLVIEVKGGDVSCTDGIWRFEDRWGRIVEKSESPISQAQSGYSSMLKNFLFKDPGRDVVSRVASGFCTVFRATRRQAVLDIIGGPEMPSALVGTLEDCSNALAFGRFLDRVVTYWREHTKGSPVGWGAGDIHRIVKALRPSFDRVQPISTLLTRVREEQFALTEDQYRFLDYMESAPRVLGIGGAGCGKTFLAVECLRREMPRNPILVTGTQSLAAHLREMNVPDRSRILSFAEAKAKIGTLEGRYETLIVDEGQQISNESAFEVFSRLLGNPLAGARWRWFSDPNYQVGGSSKFEATAHQLLVTQASISAFLNENCRNTPQIIRAVEVATGMGIGKVRVKGGGPEVEWAQASDHQGVLAQAANRIRVWLGDGEIAPRQIALLTSVPIEQSSIPEIARLVGAQYAKWHAGWESDPSRMRTLCASTIEEFRGLEAPFVVLCDLDGEAELMERSLYLGMTRANFGVYVASDAAARERLGVRRLASLAR